MKKLITYMALSMPLYSSVSHAGIYKIYADEELTLEAKISELKRHVQRKQERQALWRDQYKTLSEDKFEKFKDLLAQSYEKTDKQAAEAITALEANAESETSRHATRLRIKEFKDQLAALTPNSSQLLTVSYSPLANSNQQPISSEQDPTIDSLLSKIKTSEMTLSLIQTRPILSFADQSFYYLSSKSTKEASLKASGLIEDKLNWLEDIHKLISYTDSPAPLLSPELDSILSRATTSTANNFAPKMITEAMNSLRSNPVVIAQISELIRIEVNKKIEAFLSQFNGDIQKVLRSMEAIVDGKGPLEIGNEKIYTSQDLQTHITALTDHKEKLEEKISSFLQFSNVDSEIHKIEQAIALFQSPSSTNETSASGSLNAHPMTGLLSSEIILLQHKLKYLQTQKAKQAKISETLTEINSHLPGLMAIFFSLTSVKAEKNFLNSYQTPEPERYFIPDTSHLDSTTHKALQAIEIPTHEDISLIADPSLLSFDKTLEKSYGLEWKFIDYIVSRKKIWESREADEKQKRKVLPKQ